jgi:hypothetical protein
MEFIVYRKATLADIPELVQVALGYAKEAHPELIPDVEKMRRVAVECVSAAANYAWVAYSVDRKKIVGAIVALVHDALWAERKIANVLLWYSQTADAGRTLMRQLLTWVSSRRGIRFVGVSPMKDWDVRISRLLERRLGFQSRGGSFVWFN